MRRHVGRAGSARPEGGAREAGERLQKLIAGAGLASRRAAEAWIRAGRVTVNGQPAALGQRVGPRDEVRLDGRLVRRARGRVTGEEPPWICHRSPGEDLLEETLARLPRRSGRRFIAVSPMPRGEGGLELVAPNGAVAVRLQRASAGWDCQFRVRIRGELQAPQLDGLRAGQLDDGTRLAILGVESAAEEETEALNRWYVISARRASGKQIRQLCERQGAVVSRVLRTRLGPFRLGRDLPRGHFRAATAEELDAASAARELGVEDAAGDPSGGR